MKPNVLINLVLIKKNKCIHVNYIFIEQSHGLKFFFYVEKSSNPCILTTYQYQRGRIYCLSIKLVSLKHATLHLALLVDLSVILEICFLSLRVPSIAEIIIFSLVNFKYDIHKYDSECFSFFLSGCLSFLSLESFLFLFCSFSSFLPPFFPSFALLHSLFFHFVCLLCSHHFRRATSRDQLVNYVHETTENFRNTELTRWDHTTCLQLAEINWLGKLRYTSV